MKLKPKTLLWSSIFAIAVVGIVALFDILLPSKQAEISEHGWGFYILLLIVDAALLLFLALKQMQQRGPLLRRHAKGHHLALLQSDPLRLRMEVLNPERNQHLYGDDPLAPCRYPADALFACVMAGSPLGWFEIQHLGAKTVAAWRPLIETWKRERAAWYGGDIRPVGLCPDGLSWTGFVSEARDGKGGYALLFRGLSDKGTFSLELEKELPVSTVAACEVLAGRGRATCAKGVLTVEIPERLDFLWVRLSDP